MIPLLVFDFITKDQKCTVHTYLTLGWFWLGALWLAPLLCLAWQRDVEHWWKSPAFKFTNLKIFKNIPKYFKIQCSLANPAQAGEEAVGLADLSGLPSSFCVLVGE